MSADDPLALVGDEPTFAEPWEARAFAVVVGLCQAGYFPWDDFKTLLIAEIAAAEDAPEPGARPPGAPNPGGQGYYACWLRACERLVANKGLLTPAALAARRDHLARHPPHPTTSAANPISVHPAHRP